MPHHHRKTLMGMDQAAERENLLETCQPKMLYREIILSMKSSHLIAHQSSLDNLAYQTKTLKELSIDQTKSKSHLHHSEEKRTLKARNEEATAKNNTLQRNSCSIMMKAETKDTKL